MNATSALNLAIVEPDRRLGLQLEQMRGFNFSCMEAEAKRVFKNTALRLRFVPLAHRVSLDGTNQYNRAVVRLLKGVSETQQQLVHGLLKELRVDVKALEAEQQGVLQQGYIQSVLPGRDGRLKLKTWLPYQVAEHEFDDEDEDEIPRLSKLVLLKPLVISAADRAVAAEMGAPQWCARYVLTRSQAFIEYPDGKRRGLYTNSGENPLGRVPAIGTRRVTPIDGTGWLPRPAEDVWTMAVGLILALSDCEEIIRTQGPDRPTLSGMGAADVAKKQEAAPNRWMVIESPDTKADAVHFTPNIELYLRVAETGPYLLSQYRYLRPEAYQASIVTGSARRADAEGYVENAARQEQRVDALEQDRLDLIVDSYNATRAGALRLDKPELKVLYRYVQPPDNALQFQQSRAIAYQQGVEDLVRDVQIAERCTEGEAEKIIVRRFEAQARLLRSRVAQGGPGLDKIARDGVSNDLPPEARA